MTASHLGLFVGLAALVLPGAGPDDEPDVQEILRQADSATRAIREVVYEAEFHGEGSLEKLVPRVTGKVWGRERRRGGGTSPRNESPHMLRFEGALTPPGSSRAKRFAAATDGPRVQAIDYDKELFFAGSYFDARPLLQGGMSLFMQEYLHDRPFGDELEADTAEYEGTREVNGVTCHIIHVIYAQRRGEALWYFGTEDYLPRRVERIERRAGTVGRRILTVKNLDIAPGLDRDSFRLQKPEGFEERDYRPVVEQPDLLAVGSAAPDWELRAPDGRKVTLQSLRGQVVVMDFWATWCGPCKMAMPGLQKFHEKVKDRPVRVVGINCWEHEGGDPVAYMKSRNYTYTLLVDGDEVAASYGVQGIPTLYVIDAQGRVAYAQSGYSPELDKQLVEIVEKALRTRDGT